MNLLRTLLTISGMTMLSRITGLVRELLIARAFGASGFTDAFFVAFRIPNLLRRLFAEGAFSQAFVPILAEYANKKGTDPAKELIDKVATALMWTLLLITIAGIVAAPGVVWLVATGLDGNSEIFGLSVLMTRIMFPYILFMSMVALAGGVLNTWREFRIPAITPVLLNVTFIIDSLFVAPYLSQPVLALAGAVFVGGLLQLAIQIPALKKIGMLPRISFNFVEVFKDAGVQRIIRQMVPAVFAVSVAQVSLMINTNIASRLVHGSVSWISYADRLMEFPNALLGIALGTILLPSLSKAHANNDDREYSSLMDWGRRLTFLLARPASIMLMTLAVPFTATLFNYGKFNAVDVDMTAYAVIDCRADSCAGFLCKAGYQDTRQNCSIRSDSDTADEPAFCASFRPCRSRAIDRDWSLRQCRYSVLHAPQEGDLPAGKRMENLFSEAGRRAGSPGCRVDLVGQLFRLDRDASAPIL